MRSSIRQTNEKSSCQRRVARMNRLHQQVRRLLEALRADTAGEQIPLTPTVEADLLRLRPEEPGDSIGPYKLREQLGQGGFGTVWVADQDQPVHRRVALKIINWAWIRQR